MKNVSLSPKLCSANVLPTATKQEFFDPVVHEQWIQSTLFLSIVSHSHLLREALIRLLQNHLSHSFTDSLIDNMVHSSDPVPSRVKLSKHLVLLDCGIGRDAIMTYIQHWRELNPSPYVVVLEVKLDTDLILDCIEAGAHAYALQGASSTQISQVIEQVYQGVFQCSPEITTKLFERLSQPRNLQQTREKPPLTRRELEVLHYVAKDYSDREIAAQLVVEVRTVKHHVHNILRKLNVRHRWDAAQLALKNCWLDLTSS